MYTNVYYLGDIYRVKVNQSDWVIFLSGYTVRTLGTGLGCSGGGAGRYEPIPNSLYSSLFIVLCLV